MERVLVTGASGPIGTALLASFSPQVQVARLVRGAPRNADEIHWNPMAPLSSADVSGFDAVVHLAGESVVGRWTDAKKKAIRDSRVFGTRHLAAALAQAKHPPRMFICASAVGFYGDRGDEALTESSPSGTGFAAELAKLWEAESQIAAKAGIRTVNLRIGLVLSNKGGALQKMLLPFKLGLGGRLGRGTQWWSWIHVGDIVGAVHHIFRTESLTGPVNVVAPSPVRNSEFTRALAATLGRPAIFPIPAWAARLAFGEMAEGLMLTSQKVMPAKLESTGFAFRFRELRPALDSLI